MSNLIVLIPAAGESRRFKAAGYYVPKPLLTIKHADGKIAQMISFVIDSTPKELEVYVALPANIDRKSVNFLNTFFIEQTTGQADTVNQCLKYFHPHDSILILDCDIILHSSDIKKLLTCLEFYDAVVAVTKTFDPNASRVDQVPFPTYFVEKKPISAWGIVGARAFKNIKTLQTALKDTLINCKMQNIEPYISMTLNYYPGEKFAHIIYEFQDWGTPERIKESGAKII